MEETKLPEAKFPEYLNKLIEGCSTQTKVSVQVWIAAATLSIVTIIHEKKAGIPSALPFSLGSVSDNAFYPIAYVVIALLFICFASAVCQAIRARRLIQRIIENLDDSAVFKECVYPQDVVDVCMYPTLNRVGPLAQMLHSKKQFYPELFSASRFSKILSGTWYIFLRIVACFCLYGLLMYALWIAYCSIDMDPANSFLALRLFYWIIGGCVLITLTQLLVMDFIYTLRASDRINAHQAIFH